MEPPAEVHVLAELQAGAGRGAGTRSARSREDAARARKEGRLMEKLFAFLDGMGLSPVAGWLVACGLLFAVFAAALLAAELVARARARARRRRLARAPITMWPWVTCDALRGPESWQPSCDLPIGHAGPHRWRSNRSHARTWSGSWPWVALFAVLAGGCPDACPDAPADPCAALPDAGPGGDSDADGWGDDVERCYGTDVFDPRSHP